MESLLNETSLPFALMTSIFVGVWVLCTLNLFFGYTLSGLVVPGLIVPVFISLPFSGVLIVIESILTWLCVKILCHLLPNYLNASRLFGRDRFFSFLIIAIPIRLLVEDFAVPTLLVGLGSKQIVYELHSQSTTFGLIIVPLLANLFWKPGLRRGFTEFFIVTGLTYVITKLVLIDRVNLCIDLY